MTKCQVISHLSPFKLHVFYLLINRSINHNHIVTPNHNILLKMMRKTKKQNTEITNVDSVTSSTCSMKSYPEVWNIKCISVDQLCVITLFKAHFAFSEIIIMCSHNIGLVKTNKPQWWGEISCQETHVLYSTVNHILSLTQSSLYSSLMEIQNSPFSHDTRNWQVSFICIFPSSNSVQDSVLLNVVDSSK